MAGKDGNSAEIGRRHFLRSIFGLGSVAESAVADTEVEAAQSQSGKFFWTSLHTGQIGFPSGHSIPSGMPGSIMKLVAVAALTDTRVMSGEEKFDCRGSYRLQHETLHCLYPHGIVDMPRALGLSCNGYFARASEKLSSRIFLDYAARLGLDRPVADFDPGRFPVEKSAAASSKYLLGLSQDLQPSALQILRLSALIANMGKLPYLHSAEKPDKNAAPYELELAGLSWQVMHEGMKIAAREGTARKLDPENKLKIAVKTGTTPHGKTFQSWITGYFPWDAPRYAFVLRAPAGSSQDEAVPQARSFLFSAEWP